MSTKKIWKKPSIIVIDVGKCKFCHASMINTESFVAFYGGEKAHYECMKKDDYKKIIEKEKNNGINCKTKNNFKKT